MKQVLVYGFYGKYNLGDELFKFAFEKLFPNYQFTFTDLLKEKEVSACDALIFGGGSFLYSAPNVERSFIFEPYRNKTLYLGIGGETEISSFHQEGLKSSPLIAGRYCTNRLNKFSNKVLLIPDLAFSLQDQIQLREKINKILFLPNTEVLPRNSDPHWKHAAWNYYKSEMSQALDILVERGNQIEFGAMSSNQEMDDAWAAGELVSFMTNRYGTKINCRSWFSDPESLSYFSQYKYIISQRFHGNVLAEINKVPYLNIYHHDKMQGLGSDRKLSYFGLTKDQILRQFDDIDGFKFLDINLEALAEMQRRVIEIIGV